MGPLEVWRSVRVDHCSVILDVFAAMQKGRHCWRPFRIPKGRLAYLVVVLVVIVVLVVVTVLASAGTAFASAGAVSTTVVFSTTFEVVFSAGFEQAAIERAETAAAATRILRRVMEVISRSPLRSGGESVLLRKPCVQLIE